MSSKSYIDSLCKINNLSYKDLAKEVGISYSTLNGILNTDNRIMTPKQLKKFGDYTHFKDYEVFYQTLKDNDLPRQCTIASLLYLGQMYCSGQAVLVPSQFFSKISFIPAVYAGSFYKKRSGNGLTIVEDWDQLKEDYWDHYYKKIIKKEYSNDLLISMFNTENDFFVSVLFFGLRRICMLKDVNIINYHLVSQFNNEIYMLDPFFPKKLNIGFKEIQIDANPNL